MQELKKSGKFILIIVIIFVMLGAIYYAILDGIIGIVGEKILEIASGIKKLVTNSGNSMYCYEITEETAMGLKQTMETRGIGTDDSELTSITLKKMLLAYFLSSYTTDSLIVAEINEQELNLIEEKYEGKITEDNAQWNSSIDIYKITDTFFYFKDNGSLSADSSTDGKYYLGAYGIIKITNMSYVDYSEYQTKANEYIGDPISHEDFLEAYSIDNEGNIIYYDIEKTTSKSSLQFVSNKSDDSEIVNETVFKKETTSSKIGNTNKRTVSEILRIAGVSEYSIQIELLIDLLEIPGSMQFVDEFIDFAADNTSVSISLTPVDSGETTYLIENREIDDDFILEVFDFNQLQNFEYYKDLILPDSSFNRKFVNASQTKIFKDSIYKMSDEMGKKVKDIDYDPGVGVALGSIDEYLKLTAEDNLEKIEIREITEESNVITSRELSISKVNAWYGEMTYPTATDENIKTNYYVDASITTEEEYNNASVDEMMKNSVGTEIEETDQEDYLVYIFNNYADGISAINNKIVIAENEDIYDEEIENYIKSNKDDYAVDDEFAKKKFIIYGLAKAAMNDEGDFDSNFGSAVGSDYLYSNYKLKNAKSHILTTNFEERVDKSTLTATTGSFKDDNLHNLLALLCNRNGTIEGAAEGFLSKESGGKVVEYEDMYKSNAKVGDLLLDNGAEMLFELLNSSSNTQKLVNVFKYLASLYSGIDYGVDIDSLTYIFNLNSVTSIYGDSPEEKVWYALINAGYSEIATAAVMGNIYGESGFNPSTIEGGYNENTGGIGLCQWTNSPRSSGEGRNASLKEYSNSKGLTWQDVDTQVEFLITEINGDGVANGYASAQMNGTYNEYNKSDWENATDIEEATKAFCYVFERPAASAAQSSMSKRVNQSKTYYEAYKGKTMPEIGEYSGEIGQKICAAAAKIREHCNSNGYSYNVTVPSYEEGVRALWNKKGVCCASYVAWTLVESGVVSEDYINSLAFRGATTLGQGLQKIFTTVSKDQMQAGDIIVWPGHHTQIYAGDNYWYNAGTSPVKYSQYDAIEYYKVNNGYTSYYILRPTQQ